MVLHFRCKQATCKCQEFHAPGKRTGHTSFGTYSDRHELGLCLHCAGVIALLLCCAVLCCARGSTTTCILVLLLRYRCCCTYTGTAVPPPTLAHKGAWIGMTDRCSNNEAHEARSMKPFFPGFSKQKSRFTTGHARRVGCLFYLLCMFLCIRQHRNRPLRSTAFNAHGNHASPDGLCARPNNNEAFSCWSCCKSFRVGRARRGNMYF